jgi:hypothetical protein
MIRVQITDRLIAEAQELIEGIKPENMSGYSVFKDENLLMGAIGEVAVIDYCWTNDLLAYKHQSNKSDIQLHSSHTIEVKVQKVTAPPQMHYRVNFASMMKDKEKSDFFFFVHLQYVAGRPEAVWLLGGCSWDKFFRMATLHHEGEPMMRHHADGNHVPNGRYYNTDCHDLPISQLAPPSAALKHFKSLQAKEEAI